MFENNILFCALYLSLLLFIFSSSLEFDYIVSFYYTPHLRSFLCHFFFVCFPSKLKYTFLIYPNPQLLNTFTIFLDNTCIVLYFNCDFLNSMDITVVDSVHLYLPTCSDALCFSFLLVYQTFHLGSCSSA